MKKIVLILFVTIGLLQADFIRDDSKGVVVDTSTNLMWQDNVSSVQKTWEEAINYCENLIIDGYDDWRLPNFNEFYSITDRSKINPDIGLVFQNLQGQNEYWTSTSIAKFAYFIGFPVGGYTDIFSKDQVLPVICVRDDK